MKRLFVVLLFLCALPLHATIKPNEFKKWIEARLPYSHVGVEIIDAETGKSVLDYQAQQLFHPASNTKLLTATSALLTLKRDYRYPTEMRFNPKNIQNGVLKGDVSFVFYGDPSFEREDLNNLIKRLKTEGIRQIEGNVILDDYAFKGQEVNPHASMEDTVWYYAAPARALNLDENKLMLHLAPSALGQIIKIESDESTPYHIESQVKSVTLEESMHCEIDIHAQGDTILLSGCWPQSYVTQTLQLAVPDVLQYAQYHVNESLVQHQITLSGMIQHAHHQNDPINDVHYSKPLYELIKPLLTDSNNLYAECMSKTLGDVIYHHASSARGADAIRTTLLDHELLDFTHAQVLDASGASNGNLLSPHLLTQLLYSIYHDSELKKDILNALPIGGFTGTLKERMKSPALKGHVFAKTGSKRDVSTLSGFYHRKNKTYIFSILINTNLNGAEARQLQEEILEKL